VRLAELEAIGQLPPVVMPDPATRQRRMLIAFRRELVGRRVACQNRIRALFATKRLTGGQARKKPAVVALARKILVRCWAMLRDGAPWRDESVASAAGR
jgi:hypothetical protein